MPPTAAPPIVGLELAREAGARCYHRNDCDRPLVYSERDPRDHTARWPAER
jgi:hypothetical protein